MKAPAILAACLALAGPAASGSIADCTLVSEIAQTAMDVRQMGVPIHEAMNHVADNLDGSDLDFAIALFEAAYAEPLYFSEPAKASASSEFAGTIYLMCREGA